ncbi:MAG: Ger(x)C family spore germination protein [Syntrophomonadaceae bacterium]|nr:Ger(x)C family spore germination protein [Syntrophomonadaceae bacterium]
MGKGKKLRARALFLLLVLLLPALGGCWDQQDIDSLDMPIAAGFDVDAGGNIVVSSLIPNVSQTAERKYHVDTVTGITVGEARRIRSFNSGKTYDVASVRVLLYGEELSRQGLTGPMDSVARRPQIADYLPIAVVQGTAEEVLNIKTQDYPNIGQVLITLLENSNRDNFGVQVSVHEFTRQVKSVGQNPVCPLLHVNGDHAEIIGCAVFKKDKMIGDLDTDQTRALLLLRGEDRRGYASFTLREDGQTDRGSVLLSNRREMELTRKDGKLHYNITVNLEGTLEEHGLPRTLTDQQDYIRKVENQVKRDVQRQCDDVLKYAEREFGIDCFDLSRHALARWRPELEDSIEENFWDMAEIQVEVKVKIKGVGQKLWKE